MNFKKPKMENLTGALVTGGSAVAGAAASNLLVAELTKKPSGDEKKDKSKRQLVKGGAVAAALLGLACVDGNDTSANALRGAFVGMAGAQGISLAREIYLSHCWHNSKTCFRPWLPLSRTTRRLGLCRPA